MWNPWRGCHKCSEGCAHCYIHKGDWKRNVDTNVIMRTEGFSAPIAKKKDGSYKMKGGQVVYLCFSSDFLLEEADAWRAECWAIIKERSDLTFLFLTKRISRFMDCVPSDWGEGYDNVVVGCTVENQANVDCKLAIFATLPIKHKNIICQPLIERVSIEKYLSGVELVVVGGESDNYARVLHYDWVLLIRDECVAQSVAFEFRQCGTNFVKDGKAYRLQTKDLCAQARKAGINWRG